MRSAWIVLSALLVLGCSSDRPRKGEDPQLLLDRIWIDRLPEKHTEYSQIMLVLAGQPIGVFQRASSYDMHLEVFMYRREGGRVAYRFPQSDKKGELTYRIAGCNDLPPFDLCLELSQNPWGGPKRYHGMRDEAGVTLLSEIRHGLEAHLPR